jgi:hypothetical protein
MATAPSFAATPRAAGVSISTANTNRDGTGTVGTVITAGASGTKIEEVVVVGTGTVTAGMVRLFLYDGTTYYLFDEVAITATTPSATVQVYRARRAYPNLTLPNGWSLRASTHNAETFIVEAFGGDL